MRTLQLGSLPGSTASEGHLDGALKDITDREAANNRIFEFDGEFANLATRVQTFLWVSACIIRGQALNSGDMTYVDRIASDF